MVIFFCLLIFWLICSGQFSLFFAVAASLSILATIVIYKKLFTSSTCSISEVIPEEDAVFDRRSYELRNMDMHHSPFFFYIFIIKLLKEMFISSMKVAKIIWLDYEEIKPYCVLIEVESLDIRDQVIQANSITLTPGTMSLELKDNKILVHAINAKMAQSLEGA